MAIFKFDCFIPYCCFLDFGFGMAMVIVSLQIGIGEYVNFGYPNDSNLHLFSDSKTNRDSLSGKWIDLTTAIVFYILFH
jgi:hypothetical protein